MAIGLSKGELVHSLYLGNNPGEITNFILKQTDGKINNQEELTSAIILSVLEKVAECILLNNKRIEEQFIASGIHLKI